MKKNSPELPLNYHFFPSALGWILVAAGSRGISLLHFCGPSVPSRDACEILLKQVFSGAAVLSFRNNPVLDEAEEAVMAYLHDRRPFLPLPLEVRSGTPFQHRVWDALCEIPFGQTRSYLQVAQAVGQPGASRAVGQACGKNPVPLLIPCHRVVAADGGLGGFSGGIRIKEALLAIERSPGLT